MYCIYAYYVCICCLVVSTKEALTHHGHFSSVEQFYTVCVYTCCIYTYVYTVYIAFWQGGTDTSWTFLFFWNTWWSQGMSFLILFTLLESRLYRCDSIAFYYISRVCCWFRPRLLRIHLRMEKEEEEEEEEAHYFFSL